LLLLLLLLSLDCGGGGGNGVDIEEERLRGPCSDSASNCEHIKPKGRTKGGVTTVAFVVVVVDVVAFLVFDIEAAAAEGGIRPEEGVNNN